LPLAFDRVFVFDAGFFLRAFAMTCGPPTDFD
jgi:hypothetical protein